MQILNKLGITIPDDHSVLASLATYAILDENRRTILNIVTPARKKVLDEAYTLFWHVSQHEAVEQAIRERYYGISGPYWPRSASQMCIEIAMSADTIDTETCLGFAFAPILEYAFKVSDLRPNQFLLFADFDVGWCQHTLDLLKDE